MMQSLNGFLKRCRSLPALALACGLIFGLGCDGGGGGGGGGDDIGDNNAGVFIALGDSITQGRCVPAGAPYPDRVASTYSVTVINSGSCGETSGGGASRVGSLLAQHKPEGVFILYGANDVIQGRSLDGTIANLRSIIQAVKGNQSRAIIADLTPMYDGHAIFQPLVETLNPMIKSLASQEGAKFVSLSREFGQERALIQADGLHPSDLGTQAIAFAFGDRI